MSRTPVCMRQKRQRQGCVSMGSSAKLSPPSAAPAACRRDGKAEIPAQSRGREHRPTFEPLLASPGPHPPPTQRVQSAGAPAPCGRSSLCSGRQISKTSPVSQTEKSTRTPARGQPPPEAARTSSSRPCNASHAAQPTPTSDRALSVTRRRQAVGDPESATRLVVIRLVSRVGPWRRPQRLPRATVRPPAS